MDRAAFEYTLRAMKLTEGWFSEIPRDFLYLAVTREMVPSAVSQNFTDKYGTINHQSLEFFGDRILSTIASMIIYQIEGLKTTPHNATLFYSDLTSNAALLDISIREKFCQSIIEGTECKYTKPTTKHNVCSDSFEAVIGACYIYGISKGKKDVILDLYKWFCSFEAVKAFLRELKPRENIEELLNISMSPPVDWDLEIDINDPNLWVGCRKSVELKIPSKPFIPKTKFRLPFKAGEYEDPLHYLDRLEKYYNTKAKWIDSKDGTHLVMLATFPGEPIFSGSSKIDKENAVKDLIEIFK